MPYVGNGHVATVIFSDFIYMNGVYNGENGLYHLYVVRRLGDLSLCVR